MNHPPRILQVSIRDILGGAEKVAWNLFQSYAARGCSSWLACGEKLTNDDNVFVISSGRRPGKWERFWRYSERYLSKSEVRGAWRLSPLAGALIEPRKWVKFQNDSHDFHYPETWRLLTLTPTLPELVHCHNLHSNYFDLRTLPWLSRQLPVVLTLHDAWLLSGLCSHSFDCERWKTGCGHCPQIPEYREFYNVQRDATASNWKRKYRIYRRSRLYVATPSEWLMNKVQQSILASAVIEARVIPNGVDLNVYRPAQDKMAIRAKLGLPLWSTLLLFVGRGLSTNPYKDYPTLRRAVAELSERRSDKPIFLVLMGEDAPRAGIDAPWVRFVPFQNDPEIVAHYYQSADLYMHAANADTFPNAIIEALACGIPVVATAVGGIPEQVKGLAMPGDFLPDLNHHGVEEATGILVPPRDSGAFVASCNYLLNDQDLRRRLSENGVRDVRARFGLERQVENYLRWYTQILESYPFKKEMSKEKRAEIMPLALGF